RCGSPIAGAASTVCPSTSSRTSRSVRPRPGGGSASAADPHPADPSAPPAPPHGMATTLLDRQLLFVTGKGGVGKTSVTAAIGHLAASQGKRVLLCDIDGKGDLAGALETGPTAFEEREVAPGLWAMAMDTEASLREYLRLQLRVPLLARLGPLARTFDFVANAAPGVKEILIVGKLAYEAREGNYDLVVADAPATGHIVGQL